MKKCLYFLKNIIKIRSFDKTTKEKSAHKEKDTDIDIVPKTSLISDSPLIDHEKDKFKRWPFAQKLAQIILSHSDSDSLVIGINGKWGEGKTSTLKFIETELKRDSRIICIWFNPWLFRDENQLLLHFFAELSNKLKKSLKSSKEIAGILLKYGSAVIPSFGISMPDGTQAEVDIGKNLDRLGENLSTVDIGYLKERLEKILKKEKKRIVILMDDIDRLDKTEIQNIFKLIKLTAEFPYTNYILTFDQEMVSAMLGEQYGGGSKEGCNFLEKIIQVPLNLPTLDKVSLRKYCFNIIDEVLKTSKIELNEDETREYVRCFINFLEIRLKTPRMAKRHGNILTFILPLIGNEVNLVDLMLIEGARIFYPDLYSFIRKNPDTFLGIHFDSGRIDQEMKKGILSYIDESLKNLDEDEKNAAKNLIKYLFPRLNCIFGGATYGSNWEENWSQNKRIASKAYFRRYFTYSIPEEDISDVELEKFLEKIKDSSIDIIISEIRKLVGETKAETFISKLRKYEKKLSVDVARNLSLAISKSGDLFPDPDMLFSFMGSFSQAAILIHWLVKLVPKDQGRFELAEAILKNGKPVSFMSECFIWMHASKEHDEDRLFTKEEENQLGAIVASHVEELSKKEVIFLNFPKATPRLLAIWFDFGDKIRLEEYLTRLITSDSQNAILLIKSFLPRAYGMETGVPVKSDFEKNTYESIKRYIDPEVLFNSLVKMFGKLDGKEYHYYGDTKGRDENKVLAEQFAFIHNKAKSENKTKDDSTPKE